MHDISQFLSVSNFVWSADMFQEHLLYTFLEPLIWAIHLQKKGIWNSGYNIVWICWYVWFLLCLPLFKFPHRWQSNEFNTATHGNGVWLWFLFHGWHYCGKLNVTIIGCGSGKVFGIQGRLWRWKVWTIKHHFPSIQGPIGHNMTTVVDVCTWLSLPLFLRDNKKGTRCIAVSPGPRPPKKWHLPPSATFRLKVTIGEFNVLFAFKFG